MWNADGAEKAAAVVFEGKCQPLAEEARALVLRKKERSGGTVAREEGREKERQG